MSDLTPASPASYPDALRCLQATIPTRHHVKFVEDNYTTLDHNQSGTHKSLISHQFSHWPSYCLVKETNQYFKE
jgi:hypothetical protein